MPPTKEELRKRQNEALRKTIKDRIVTLKKDRELINIAIEALEKLL